MEADMAVGLATKNCPNCSTIRGSKVDGCVKSVSFSTEGATTTYCGGLKYGNEGHDCPEDLFCCEA